MSFTLRITLILLFAAAAAAIVAPLAAAPLAGFHFPFPRIFDRVFTGALIVAVLWQARALKLAERIRRGFTPARPLQLLIGFAIGVISVALMGLAAARWLQLEPAAMREWLRRMPMDLVAALAIGVFEEAFFRAFLLDGMRDDFSRRPALIASAAVYALAHVLRAPARFYVKDFEPLAGLRVLGLSAAQLGHPAEILPPLFGLLLLGLVLGEAFLVTRRVYLGIGLHAALVMGARSWRVLVGAGAPRWIQGYGRPALIGSPAAWALAVVLLIVVRRWPPSSDRRASAA